MDKNKDIREFDSVVQSLFFGEVDENTVFPYPHFSEEASADTKAMLEPLKNFLEQKVDSTKFEEMREIPREIIKEISAMGLMGLGVPTEEGGLGLGYGSYYRIFGEVSGYDASLGVFIGAHQTIGYRALINEGSQNSEKSGSPCWPVVKKLPPFA